MTECGYIIADHTPTDFKGHVLVFHAPCSEYVCQITKEDASDQSILDILLEDLYANRFSHECEINDGNS